MIIFGNENNIKIRDFLNEENHLLCMVAFVGGKALEILTSEKKQCKLICNLESGATNPYVIEELMKNGIEVKSKSNLHAKIYIGSHSAIISSANLSANGLSLEDEEVEGWVECGYFLKNLTEVNSLKKIFDQEWENALCIDSAILNLAKENWQKRRIERPKSNDLKKSLLTALRDKEPSLNDRNIFFVVTREEMSDKAQERFEKIKSSNAYPDNVDAYEGWPYLPNDALLIDIQINLNNLVTVNGIYNTHPQSELIFFDKKNGEESSLTLCYKMKKFLGLKLTKEDATYLKANAIKLLKACPNENEGFYLSAFDAIEILADKKDCVVTESDLHQYIIKFAMEADSICDVPIGTYTEGMKKEGAIQWANRLAGGAKAKSGFTKIAKHNRLDLTIEFNILQYPWNLLFPCNTLDRSWLRLNKYKNNKT